MNGSEADRTKLTALLDGELAEPERSELLRRLESDASLQAERKALADARSRLESMFGDLLAQAPVAQMRAALPAADRLRASGWRRFTPRLAPASLVAGLAVGAVLGAALMAMLLWRGATADDDWVDSVLASMRLFAPQTFAPLQPDAQGAERQLAALSEKLGLPLTPAAVTLSGLSFKMALGLDYEGASLGQIVLADGSGAPSLFCILADGSKPEPLSVTTRGEFTIATWAKEGKRFLVASHTGAPVEQWARALTAKL